MCLGTPGSLPGGVLVVRLHFEGLAEGLERLLVLPARLPSDISVRRYSSTADSPVSCREIFEHWQVQRPRTLEVLA
eukprot:2292691-Rhodomonas_salina.1